MQYFWRQQGEPEMSAREPSGGLPRRRALIAAMMLHAAIIAGAMLDWRRPVAAPPLEPVPVRLVMALPPASEPDPPLRLEDAVGTATSEPTPPDPPSSPADAVAEYQVSPPPASVSPPERELIPEREPAAENAENKPSPPPPAKPKAPASRKSRVAARSDPPKDKSPTASEPAVPGVAVYHVLVGANGDIRSITLARSSGTKAFDDAGIEVVRNTISEAQAQGQRAEITGFFEVTLNFSAAPH